MKCIVGGDFNADQSHGWRGERFGDLLCEADLHVCNNAWTFKSCPGAKRVLNYCLASIGIQVVPSKAIDDLILRSDHRAVQTYCALPPVLRLLPKRKKGDVLFGRSMII